MNTTTIRSAFTHFPIEATSHISSQTGSKPGNAAGNSAFADKLRTALLYSSRMVLADAPALAIIVAAAWAADGEQSARVLQAGIWSAGFVFLALAAEGAKTKHNFKLLLTSLALPVLALLSYHVAVEFAVVGATLIAVWVVAAILKYQSPHRVFRSKKPAEESQKANPATTR